MNSTEGADNRNASAAHHHGNQYIPFNHAAIRSKCSPPATQSATKLCPSPTWADNAPIFCCTHLLLKPSSSIVGIPYVYLKLLSAQLPAAWQP